MKEIASARLEEAVPVDCSTARVLAVPSLLCLGMVVLAAIAAIRSSLNIEPLLLPYMSTALAISLLAILGYVFIEVAKLARNRAENPARIIGGKAIERAPLMILPAVVLPIFLIAFTSSKSAIQFIVGYPWDSFFANADRFIFGDDVWHLTRIYLGSAHSWIWQWFYTVGWGGVFFATANAISLFASKRFVGTYFTAMFATWLIGGCILAYSFSAAGPVFAGLFHPDLAQRFADMHRALDAPPGSGPIGLTQRYLASIVGDHVAVKGGGISAMPSMHIASTSIYVLAARRTRWFGPAVLFWLVIFIASGYFGYHYWVDGLAAAVLAAGIWRVSEAIFSTELDARLDVPISSAESMPAPVL